MGEGAASFAVLLRAHRQRRHLTLEELAARSGVSARALSDMERGRSAGPQPRSVAAILDALELTPDEHQRVAAAAAVGRHRPASPPAVGALPPERFAFFGRRAERQRIAAVFAAPSPYAVVVISGAGGLGKTALAVRVAHERGDDFPDGVVFVAMAGMTEPLGTGEAATRVLRAMGVPHRSIPAEATARAEAVVRLVSARRTLVVFDDVADEAQIRALLPAPGSACAVVVTSRNVLPGLAGDAVTVVLTPMLQVDSVELLRYALGAQPGVSADALGLLATRCGRCPLALRIAISRLLSRPGWTVQTLLGRLADEEARIDALQAGDLQMYGAMALSYDQLDHADRLAFRRLGLVAGPEWNAEAVSVLADVAEAAGRRTLDRLVDLTLVESVGDDRYRLHDVVRWFARRQLSHDDDPALLDAARLRWRTWLLVTATRAGQVFEPDPGPTRLPPVRPDVRFTDHAAADGWLRAEAANWVPALRDAAAAGEHQLVVDVAEALHWFSDRMVFVGFWGDVFGWAEAAAAALGRPDLQAAQLGYLAWVSSEIDNDFRASLGRSRQAYRLAARAGSVEQQGWALVYAAAAHRGLGAQEDSLADATEAGRLFAEVGDDEGEVQAAIAALRTLLVMHRFGDVVERGARLLATVQDAAAALSPTISVFTTITARQMLAEAHAGLGEHRAADHHARSAVDTAVAAGLPVREARARRAWAGMLQARQRHGDAREQLRLARQRATEAGDAHEVAAIDERLARSPRG